jgi:hypothetical protein
LIPAGSRPCTPSPSGTARWSSPASQLAQVVIPADIPLSAAAPNWTVLTRVDAQLGLPHPTAPQRTEDGQLSPKPAAGLDARLASLYSRPTHLRITSLGGEDLRVGAADQRRPEKTTAQWEGGSCLGQVLDMAAGPSTLQNFAVVGECCGLRNRPQSAPTRSAMASAEEPAVCAPQKFRRYTLSFDNVL